MSEYNVIVIIILDATILNIWAILLQSTMSCLCLGMKTYQMRYN